MHKYKNIHKKYISFIITNQKNLVYIENDFDQNNLFITLMKFRIFI